ncbi:hypothetical protein AGMMS49975_24330 [Clostridia bacterium]|nr:hypothetical protein AGMMS49975_24330 [Clostridia bacterium]
MEKNKRTKGEDSAKKSNHQTIDKTAKKLMHFPDPVIVDFINALFSYDFPLDSKVSYINNDYQGNHFDELRADVMLRIRGEKDGKPFDVKFHAEVQSENDKTMALRVFQYSYMQALDDVKISKNGSLIELPLAEPKILYVDKTRNTPKKATVRIVVQSKKPKHFDYTVDALCVTDYTPKELSDNHFFLLLPLYIAKYRKRVAREVKSGRGVSEKTKNELKNLLNEICNLANEHKDLLGRDGVLNLIEYTNSLYDNLYDKVPELREVKSMTLVEKVLRDPHAKWAAEGETRGVVKGLLLAKNILRLNNQGYNAQEISEQLNIPVSDINAILEN